MQITLALGGGGSKGCAHIGVLRCLQQHHFQIKAIAGTSVGAAIGAVFAAGYSPEEILARLETIDLQRLFTHGKQETPSLLGFYGLEKLLHEFLGERTFEQLKIPFAVTATDLKHSHEVILNQGRVIDAVKASMAIPGVFPSRPWNEYLLVDGGVMGNVPVSVARQFHPNLPVIAVVLSSYEPGYEIISPLEQIPTHPIFQQVIRLRVAQALNIFLTSMELSTNLLTELRLKIEKPEVIIRPNVKHIGLLAQVNFSACAQLGYEATKEMLPKLHRAVSLRSRIWRMMTRSLKECEPIHKIATS